MRALVARVALALSIVTLPNSLVAQEKRTAFAFETAASLYARGEYEAAIVGAEKELAANSGGVATAVALVRALTDVGRPADAIARAATWRTDPAMAPAIAAAFESMGKLAEADAAWRSALRGPDSLRARVEQLRLDRERRGGTAALASLNALVATVEARPGAVTASESYAIATASRLLGRNDPQRFKDALRWYDRALVLDPALLDARAELGALFLEKFNFADARQTLSQVMRANPRHPRALAALVRLNSLDATGGTRDPLAALLAVNPHSADGHALAARRLIDAEQYDAAEAEARNGLEIDSTAPGPWVAIAAARWLANDTAGHRAALDQAHRRLPGSAYAEVELADVSARNRLYGEAVKFARAGFARDARDARAQALLGINLLRIGQPVAARETLERAFALDPYDVWVKNTLDLLDAYAKARTIATEHFEFVIETGDADLMALYAAPLAEQAYTALTTRYGFQPSERVRIEFFRSHADFSVRAVGLAGLGALGVAFGNVLAIDEPPARRPGDFSWASVLWHEFTHTITLGATDNRVPRWVSEGLSVYEERRARPDWGGGVTPSLIAAFGVGRLQPVSRLNDGFVHPRYDEEVILSYALSAFVFEMLEERKGIDGLRALLSGYRAGGHTPQLMQQVYGLEPAALDSVFDGWFRTKFAREFASVHGEVTTAPDGSTRYRVAGPLQDTLAIAYAAAERKDWPVLLRSARSAVALFPLFVEPFSGYYMLAGGSLATADSAGARAAFAAITARNGDAVEENTILAGLLLAVHDSVGAIAALERATLIDPFAVEVQLRLGELAFARRVWPAAVRARRAVIALGPSDRADALYRLAQALAAAGDFPAARKEVLRSLDLAPNFEAAQDLLLTIRSSGKAP